MMWTTMEKIRGIVEITVLQICPMFPDNSCYSYRYNHIWIETSNTTLISIFELLHMARPAAQTNLLVGSTAKPIIVVFLLCYLKCSLKY